MRNQILKDTKDLITSLENPNLLDVLRIMENDYSILDTTENSVKVRVLNSIVEVSLELWTQACMIKVL